MAQLQSKITQMNEMVGQMEGADGVDANEYAEVKSELADFDTRWSTVAEQTSEEEKRWEMCFVFFYPISFRVEIRIM